MNKYNEDGVFDTKRGELDDYKDVVLDEDNQLDTNIVRYLTCSA